MGKVTFDLHVEVKQANGSISIRSDVLEIELDPKELENPAAVAAAAAIRRGIGNISERSEDGTHALFNKTGHLREGITSSATGEVLAPPGYLEDDKLVVQLRNLVPPLKYPLADPAVQLELEHVLGALLKVTRTRGA